MAHFSDLFFTQQKTSQNNNADSLSLVYFEPAVDYQGINDFDQCKAQLLKLLNYIVSLDPVKLKIFNDYKENIASSLTKETNPKDIEITLKAAKKSLESSLSLIQESHQRLSSNVFDIYTVTACFSGAHSNLESILEHFNPGNFADLVASAKKRMLQNLILEFVRINHYGMPAGNEIHRVNGLYNLFADAYGCPTIVDHLANMHFYDSTISDCNKYIKKKFRIDNFITVLTTMAPMPPETTLNTPELLSEMEAFFRFLGINSDEKRHLYTLDDDYVNLIPRPNFSTYLQYIIVAELEKNQYLQKVYWHLHMPDHILQIIDNGNGCVALKRDEDGETIYSILDEETIRHIIKNPQLPKYLYLTLIMNSPEILCTELETKSRPDSIENYFWLLLKHDSLPENIIIRMFDFLYNNSEISNCKRYFAAYVFDRFYSLDVKLLRKLAEEFNNEECHKYFDTVLHLNKYDYVEAIVTKENLSLENLKKIMHNAVCSVNVDLSKILFKRLHELGYALDEFRDSIGNTLTHIIVLENLFGHKEKKENASKILEELVRYGLNLNSYNQFGRSAMQVAYLRESDPILLRKLHSLGATLSLFDANGKEIINLYNPKENMMDGHKFMLDGNKLMELVLKGYEFFLERDSINWKQVLGIKLAKNSTLAHNAAVANNVDLLKLMNEYQINLEQKDFLKWSPVFCAVKHKRKEAFCFLAELGVDLHTIDKNGNTLAHQICKDTTFSIKNKKEWLTLIAQYGAKLDQKNNQQLTPLDMMSLQKKSTTKEKTIEQIGNLIEHLIKEQNTRNNELTNTDNMLGARSPSMLTQFDARASKNSKRHIEDTIHRSPRP